MSLGKIVKDYPPKEGNRRNSEGAFIQTEDGRIAFVFSRFRGGKEDGDASDLAVAFSSDGGETFSKERVFLTPEECDAVNLMSVSLLKMQDGSIGVFYLKKSRGMQCVYYMRRTNDFVNVSEEIRCLPDDGYFVVNNDRVRRLRNGRLIFPAAYIKIERKTSDADHNDYSKSIWHKGDVRFYCSNDDGKTWRRLGTECAMPHEISSTGLQEPGMEELEDGRLYAYFRNDLGRQYESYSSDEGETWSVPAPSVFTSPESPMSMKRLSDGRFSIVYNPAPLYYGREEVSNGVWTGGRNPFVIRFGDGDFKTIGNVKAFENDETSGFCYCAIFETDTALLLGYCAGGQGDGNTLARLRIRKIEKETLA